MKKPFNKRSGFSLIEMLIASVIVLFLSATAYKILTSQGNKQRESVFGQKQNSQVLATLDRFKKEASMIDYNWTKYGVAAVYPHQGLGLGDNFYVNPFTQTEGLSDGVTFLKRNVDKSNLYTLAVNAEHPAVTGASVLLYNAWLTLDQVPADIKRNDWVILYSPGKYALGVVTAKRSNKIRIRQPLPDYKEIEITHFNSFVNRSSGYVTKAGVVPGSFDWTGTNTATTDDDSIKFDSGKTYVQVVQPVSYELDWATNDKQPSGTGNQHILDEDGNPKKVIVRTEYSGGGTKREYLAEANQMGLTYDALVALKKDNAGNVISTSLDGFSSGDIVKDIGRETTSTIQLVNLTVDPNATSMTSDAFVATSNIISLRMFVGADTKKGQEQNQKVNEIRVALDPSRINDQYQGASSALAQNSGNLFDTYGLSGQKIGQPLYIRHKQNYAARGARMGHQVYVPGTGVVDVVVPVGTIDPDPKNLESGKLIVMDENGDPATANVSCSGPNCCTTTNCEQIKFAPTETNQYFLPSTMIEKSGDGSGTNKILIGGFSVTVDSKTQALTRKPMMAEIEYPEGMKFRDFVAANNQSNIKSGDTCSLGSSCRLIAINEQTIVGSSSRLRDTAAGMAVDGDDVYMASITRDSGQDGTLSVYKTDTAFTTFTEKVVDDTQGISKNRVISAISQSPIEIAGVKYLPIATSRSIANATTPAEDGKILLYNLSNASAPPIEIANHNFKVNSMTSMDGNLVFSGKLVTQVMKAEDIAAIVQGAQTTVPTFFTDELANFIPATASTPAVKQYADGYFTLSSAYSNQSTNTYQQVLGWNTGVNAAKISDMEYGFVLGNQSIMGTSFPKPGTYEQQDFTTVSVNFGGISERVIASIDTDFTNLEASAVVVRYDKQESKVPNVLLPGVMYSATNPRVDPAPLPALTKVMSENQWIAFYQDFIDIKDHVANTTPDPLPDPNVAIFQCGNSVPPTCSTGH